MTLIFIHGFDICNVSVLGGGEGCVTAKCIALGKCPPTPPCKTKQNPPKKRAKETKTRTEERKTKKNGTLPRTIRKAIKSAIMRWDRGGGDAQHVAPVSKLISSVVVRDVTAG